MKKSISAEQVLNMICTSMAAIYENYAVEEEAVAYFMVMVASTLTKDFDKIVKAAQEDIKINDN